MLPVHGAHRLLRGRAGRHGQLLAGRLREPLHRGEHQHERRGRLPRAGQDLPRGDDSLRHGAGQPQHHHGRGQQPRVQLRAHDHRRVRLHADERRGLVRRPGQPAGHADDRPAAKDRGQGGRLDRGLPFPLRQGHGNRARGVLQRPADRLRHPCRKFGDPALRHPALHLSRGRTVAHPDRPGAPRRRHGRAAIHRGGGQAHHRRVDEMHPRHGRLGQRRGTGRLYGLFLRAGGQADGKLRVLERRHPRRLGTQARRGGQRPLPAARSRGARRHGHRPHRRQAHRFLHRIRDAAGRAGHPSCGHLVRRHGGRPEEFRGGDRRQGVRPGCPRGARAVEPGAGAHPHRRGQRPGKRRSSTRRSTTR